MSAPVNIRHANWSVVQAMVGNDIPYSELPTDPTFYKNELGVHLNPDVNFTYRSLPAVVTGGVIRFIERHRSMKKEAEFRTIIERLENQQISSNDKCTQLSDQYQKLLVSYTAMKNAYKAETEVTKALKKQLDDTLEILKSLGVE